MRKPRSVRTTSEALRGKYSEELVTVSCILGKSAQDKFLDKAIGHSAASGDKGVFKHNSRASIRPRVIEI
jgi:hypothetical protein